MSGKSAEGAETPARQGGKGKLVVIAVAALVLLAGGGAGAAWFLGLFGPATAAAPADGHGEDAGHGGEAAAADSAHAAAADGHGEGGGHGGGGSSVAFVDLPDVVVNLQSTGSRMRFLKLRVSLEVLGQSQADEIKLLTPRIMDSFQLYLRALDVDDVQGAIGMQRLKEEMLSRVHRAVEPQRIEDVLIKEMLVQ